MMEELLRRAKKITVVSGTIQSVVAAEQGILAYYIMAASMTTSLNI